MLLLDEKDRHQKVLRKWHKYGSYDNNHYHNYQLYYNHYKGSPEPATDAEMFSLTLAEARSRL